MNILHATDLPWRSEWPGIFGAHRPLCLEIGFGDGRYLAYLAGHRPEQNVLGMEISHRSLRRAERLLRKHANLRLLHASAELAITQLFAPGDLAEVHINFPDPWFKQRHEKRRLLRDETLKALLNRMAPGALLYLATDVRPYAEACDALFQGVAALTNALPTPWANERPLGPPTKYEQIAREAGRNCYYFAYRRDESAVPAPQRIWEGAMPHLVYQSPLSLAETGSRFAPRARSAPLDSSSVAHIHFLGVFGAPEQLLFEAFIREGALHQRVALLLAKQRPGDDGGSDRYTLSLSGIGHPRATAGCHLALAILGRWLLRLHPEARVIHQRIRGWDEVVEMSEV